MRIVNATELYTDINQEDEQPLPQIAGVHVNNTEDGTEYEVVGENGEVVVRTNRNVIDDSKSQTMTMDEIETLKAGKGSGRDLIAKILDSHVALDQKTAFALAKYTLRKTRKFLRRFTVLPLDVPVLARFITNHKEPAKIMELREETLALINSLSNVHYTPQDERRTQCEDSSGNSGRWLVIDETGGLIIASMAERMGILHPSDNEDQVPEPTEQDHSSMPNNLVSNGASNTDIETMQLHRPSPNRKWTKLANGNTLTLLHANSQPNVALLRNFGFDYGNPSTSHPLFSHLKTMTWLQLLSPEEDLGYMEPDTFPDEIIRTWKSGRRGNYYRKQRRWQRIKSTVDQTRAGGFDGLVIATVMDLPTVMQHTVPLLRGGAPVVIYSPIIEPLTELADFYSSGRRSAFLTDPPDPEKLPTEDFPVDPTLLLATSIQIIKSRPWQVLPGRTHPLMTGRGGAEGYIFSATRVIPAEGKVSARGKFKRRKIGDGGNSRLAETLEHLAGDQAESLEKS